MKMQGFVFSGKAERMLKALDENSKLSTAVLMDCIFRRELQGIT
jgi:hypothetical protein